MLAIYRKPLIPLWNRLVPAERASQVVYSIRGGPHLQVDSGSHDVRVINEVWGDRIYELDESFRPRPGWVVLDIGAHKGIFSARAASLMQHGILYSMEPAPHNYASLVRNVPQTKGLQFTPINAAAAARTGRGRLTLAGTASGLHSLYAERLDRSNDHEAVEVELVALDDILEAIQHDVDLLKLDAEGAEYEIVLDSPDAAWRRIRRAVLEYDEIDPRDCATGVEALRKKFVQHGFDVRLMPERHLLWAARET